MFSQTNPLDIIILKNKYEINKVLLPLKQAQPIMYPIIRMNFVLSQFVILINN